MLCFSNLISIVNNVFIYSSKPVRILKVVYTSQLPFSKHKAGIYSS